MAYVNVLEWKSDQVADWLQGLDDCIQPYAQHFVHSNVTGRALLNLTVDDLFRLRVEKIGHQEIVLDGLEHLRNLHHNLDTENLQYVCLKLSCKASSLLNELQLYGPAPNELKQKISTASMVAAADVLDSLSTLVLWLDRPPFRGQQHYDDFKAKFLKIGVELATSAHRDTFAEQPANVIKNCCAGLRDLADTLIRDVNDPLILQPGSLDIATVKVKPDDDSAGIVFESSAPPGIHIVSEVKFQSPAHLCDRIQTGDEVVQINYQTVVGWHIKKVLSLMAENVSELIITVKKRPRHLPVFGQIYIKPFRIPSRQNKHYFNNLPSPRAELLVAPEITIHPSRSPRDGSLAIRHVQSKVPHYGVDRDIQQGNANNSYEHSDGDEDEQDDEEGSECDGEGDDDADNLLPGYPDHQKLFDQPSSKSPTQSVRSVLCRPQSRSSLQRRATISGSSPSHYRPYINVTEIWSHIPMSGSGSSSKTSTLRSSDSGHATMGSSINMEEAKSPPSPEPHPDQRRTKLCQQSQYINLEANLSDLTLRQPVPKPRSQAPVREDSVISPNRKKPIPQPRRISSCTKTQSQGTPTVTVGAVCPVPTDKFQSFRKYPEASYVNTAHCLPAAPPRQPPPVPPSLPFKAAHVISKVKMPAAAHPLPAETTKPLPKSTTPRPSPYYMSDVYSDPHLSLDGDLIQNEGQDEYEDDREDLPPPPSPPPPLPPSVLERHYEDLPLPTRAPGVRRPKYR